MSGKIIAIRQCSNCGANIEIRHKQRMERKNVFCCKKCEGEFKHKNMNKNVKCSYCGKPMHVKPSKMTKEYSKEHYCSNECKYNHMKTTYQGEGNHQYGLKGSLNASWKSDERITSHGYRKIRVLNHPFRDSDDFVLEHRLVAEKYLLTTETSIEIDGILYLKPELVVHHIDENKLNNSPDNLKIMTNEEHMSIHKNFIKKKEVM